MINDSEIVKEETAVLVIPRIRNIKLASNNDSDVGPKELRKINMEKK